MTSQTGQHDYKITICILPNILSSKGYQAMKFGQSIKHSIRNIFLQKSGRKRGPPFIFQKSFI